MSLRVEEKKNPKNTSPEAEILSFPPEFGLPGVSSFCRGIIKEIPWSHLVKRRCQRAGMCCLCHGLNSRVLRPCGRAGIGPGSFLVPTSPPGHIPNPSGLGAQPWRGLEDRVSPQCCVSPSGDVLQGFPNPQLVWGKASGKLVWIISQAVSGTLN